MGLLVDLAKRSKSSSEPVKAAEQSAAESCAAIHPAASNSAPAHDPKPTARSERRRQQVLAMLEATPTACLAVITDDQAERRAVIVTIAIRGKGTCDVRIPRHKYDGPRLLDLIHKHATTVH